MNLLSLFKNGLPGLKKKKKEHRDKNMLHVSSHILKQTSSAGIAINQQTKIQLRETVIS